MCTGNSPRTGGQEMWRLPWCGGAGPPSKTHPATPAREQGDEGKQRQPQSRASGTPLGMGTSQGQAGMSACGWGQDQALWRELHHTQPWYVQIQTIKDITMLTATDWIMYFWEMLHSLHLSPTSKSGVWCAVAYKEVLGIWAVLIAVTIQKIWLPEDTVPLKCIFKPMFCCENRLCWMRKHSAGGSQWWDSLGTDLVTTH